ncbi:MAG: hypothetical protein P9L94_04850 [Candidatus Hinthialibacter antarcticus]|nr:hypothetical protein [Candidatus Hinthialibacter antarcticus]
MRHRTILLFALAFTLTANAQTYSFRYQDNGFTDYGDVQIYKWDADNSIGSTGTINYNENFLLIRFGGVDIPPGLYHFDLQFNIASVADPGTITAYKLNDSNWSDPGSILNPPSTSSDFPTWSHVNYNSRAWSVPGVVGGAEIEQSIGSAYVSATGARSIGSATASIESATDFAFVLTMDKNATLFVKETAANNTQLPMLVFTLIEAYGEAYRRGGLDWNCIFRPYQSLR